jgi:hypothetical protein
MKKRSRKRSQLDPSMTIRDAPPRHALSIMMDPWSRTIVKWHVEIPSQRDV